MYAVIETGGKQYTVQEGDLVKVEKLDANEGDAVTFDKVLLVARDGEVNVGKPYFNDAKVEAKVLKQAKAKKSSFTNLRLRKTNVRKKAIVNRTRS